VVKWIYGNVGSLGSRNIRRSRQRTTLTVAALMIGVSMVIMVRGLTYSFKADLMEWIDSYLGGDILVTSSIPLRIDLVNKIGSINGVEAVTPIRFLDVKWLTPDGENVMINFMGFDPVSYLEVTSFVFSDETTDAESVVRQLQQEEAVMVSSIISERYGLDAGDTIDLRTKSGLHAFKIAAVVIDYYNQGMSIQGSWNIMRRYFRTNTATAFLVNVAEGYSDTEVLERIDQAYGQRNQLILESNMSLRQRTLRLVDQIFSFFDITSLIAVVVASFGVVNTLTMSVLERMQEIGMLRAIGMSRAQVVKMVLAEAILIGFIGDVVGFVAGILLGQVLVIGMGTMSGYELSFAMPSGDVLPILVITLIISQIAAVFPARRAARVKILEAVHYE
jgi:putative ABC transport system permease protein